MKSQLAIAFLLGAVVALAGALVFGRAGFLPEARADTGQGGSLTGVTGLVTGGNREIIWVLDGENQRLCAYDINNNRLTLLCARNIRYDMKLDQYPPGDRQTPTVREIFEQTENAGSGGAGTAGSGGGTRGGGG